MEGILGCGHLERQRDGAKRGHELNCRKGAGLRWQGTGRGLFSDGSAFSEDPGKVIAKSKARAAGRVEEKSRCVPQCGRKDLTSQV